MTHHPAVEMLIDALIGHWLYWDIHEDFYLTKLAPSLVADPTQGDAFESETLEKLRQSLSQDEWIILPQLIAERRAGILREFEVERAQRDAQEKAKHEEERERLNQEALRRQSEAKKLELFHEIRRQFHSDFLGADSFFHEYCAALIQKEDYEQEKLSFVKLWVAENTPSAKKGEKRMPDDEQVAAIAAVHGHIQVVARAGSGKTTTLVNRALFLLKHCRVAPSDILLLAFNRKAALEIRRRLLALLHEDAGEAVVDDVDRRMREAGKNKRIDRDELEANAVDTIATKLNITLPHVMTFHALAYAIVRPEESILYNGAEGEAQGLSRVFQQVVDDHLQIPVFKEQIRELMLAHFREDWDRIVEGCYDQSKTELIRFRRSLPKESLGGEYVKSYGEKVIADFLFEHGIAYKYERNHWWNEKKNGVNVRTNYRPDFTIFKSAERGKETGVIIEYFGLKGDADYDEMSNEKRAYWAAKKDWSLIEFNPTDIVRDGADSFLTLLKMRLEDMGIRCVRMSEDDIWHLIRDRAIDRFTTAMVGFIGRCRKLSLPPTELKILIDGYSPLSPVEVIFLKLAHQLYGAYLGRLSASGEEDFDGMMQRAVEAIYSGQTAFHRKTGSGDLAALRYVCIDEFQDFSDLFYRLLNAIRKQNTGVELFCVGDDWQAINGFAGSDLQFFENFAAYIGESRRLYISTNYRSLSEIVAVGNALMEGLGKPAIANKKASGKVLVSDLNEFEPSLIETQRHPGDIITPAVLRLVNKALADGIDVVMLCRRNALPWFVNYPDQVGGDGRGLARYLDLIRSFFPKGLKEHISISTTHKYKGLEKPMVIVLDAVARSYPLIHPDWAFSRIIGDSPEKITKEERRLLYVALTRAVETLVVITDGRSKSPFLEELEQRHPLNAIKWVDYPPVRGATSRLIVRVGGASTFAVKDLLYASKYKYHAVNKCWEKSFQADGFTIDTLKSEVWSKPANGIEVQIYDDAETPAALYLVNDGVWHCMVDKLVDLCSSMDVQNEETQQGN